MGLAAFTVDGVHTGFFTNFSNNWFLIIFLGVVTGVGGGVLRDVLSLEMPYIFVKHIYAIASIIGATATYLIFLGTGSAASAMLAGFFIVVGIRYLAAHFGWNLPKVDNWKGAIPMPKDPNILLSYINTHLRDTYDSLEELCRSLDLDELEVRSSLLGIGYEYDEGLNKFIPKT